MGIDDLHGKRILITGAAGALGKVIADFATDAGASLTLLDRFKPEIIHKGDLWLTGDLANPTQAKTMLEQMEPFDVALHIVGAFRMGSAMHQIADGDWDTMFAANVFALRNLARYIVPGMIANNGGSIVTVGAMGAINGQPDMAAYSASKSAGMRMVESMAAELKSTGIRVNSVLPSIIDTPANRVAMPDANFHEWVCPRDLATVMCFLGSDSARGITGALIPVTGTAQ